MASAGQGFYCILLRVHQVKWAVISTTTDTQALRQGSVCAYRRETQANRGRRHSKKGEGPGSSLSGILRRGGRGCDAKWVPVTFHTISFRRGKGGGRRRGSGGCHAAAPAQCPDVTMLLGTGRREDTCTLLLLSEEQRVDPLHLLRGVPNHSISVRSACAGRAAAVCECSLGMSRVAAGWDRRDERWQSTAIGPYGEHNEHVPAGEGCRRGLCRGGTSDRRDLQFGACSNLPHFLITPAQDAQAQTVEQGETATTVRSQRWVPGERMR